MQFPSFVDVSDKQWPSCNILKGNFSSGIEGALASTFSHDFNWKQPSQVILCIFLLMFSKFI